MVAAASSGQTVTVGNTGSPVLTIAGIATSGNNPSEFMPITTCGSSLASSRMQHHCNFRPPATRAAQRFVNDQRRRPGQSQSIALNGVGVSPGINATLSATGLSFGTVPIGEGTTRSITLSNYGTNALSITGITASPNFSETSDCGAVLASWRQLHDQRDLRAHRERPYKRRSFDCGTRPTVRKTSRSAASASPADALYRAEG